MGEAVVPVAHGRHRLDGEVQGGRGSRGGRGRRGPEGEVQHDRRHHNQCEQRRGHDGQGPVALLERDADLEPDAAGQAHGARGTVRPAGSWRSPCPATRRACRGRRHGHPRCSGWSRPGHVSIGASPKGMIATGARWPKWARKVSCVCSDRLDGELHDGEVDPGQLNGVGRPAQAGLDEGGRGQRCHVEHAARPRDPLERLRHRRVGQLHDEWQVRPDLLDAERGLQRVDLVDLDADDRGGPCQAGFVESLAPVGVAADMGHAPVVEGPPAAGIGVVVDHDDLGTAQVELLHGAQPDALEAADDHMTLHVLGAPRDPSRHVAVPVRRGGCCSVKCRRPWHRRLEPHLGL